MKGIVLGNIDCFFEVEIFGIVVKIKDFVFIVIIYIKYDFFIVIIIGIFI